MTSTQAITDIIFDNFKNLVENAPNLTKKMFLVAFMYSHAYIPDRILGGILNLPDAEYNKILIRAVNETSLCSPEIKFFTSMINMSRTEGDYIANCIDLYNKTKNLSKCTLGNLIWRQLEYAKDLVFESD